MGFWKSLFGTDSNGHFSHVMPEPTRPAPPMPTIKEPEKDISEPVRSIIQTLKDGEWSFKSSVGWTSVSVYFTHEWFGNKLTVYNFSSPCTSEKATCQSEWMTQTERESVGSVCWQIYQERVDWEREQSLAKQRESFMILVKEK